MVTKQRLEYLESIRKRNNPRLEYTISGPIHSKVISSDMAERERELALGYRAMKDAQRHMRLDQALSSLEGLSKAHFNNPEQEI